MLVAVGRARLKAAERDNRFRSLRWRARIVLLGAAGVGTAASGAADRQREAYDLALAGALHGQGHRRVADEATRPAGKPPLLAGVIERVVVEIRWGRRSAGQS